MLITVTVQVGKFTSAILGVFNPALTPLSDDTIDECVHDLGYIDKALPLRHIGKIDDSEKVGAGAKNTWFTFSCGQRAAE
ncbi:hypothetical protein [Roseovarius mucosus]|uniref:hypothetical protein n=1 Tax=Roseovarius mucosus TaxID=215743 RepID=UPI003F6E8CEC